MLTNMKNSFSLTSIMNRKKQVDALDIFVGTIERDIDLPDDYLVVSSINSDLNFDTADRYEMAVIAKDDDLILMIVNNNNSYDLYFKVNRILEDHDLILTKIYFAESNVVSHIYHNIYTDKDVINPNDNLKSFHEILNQAIIQKAANINILLIPKESARITFDIHKQIQLYRTLDAVTTEPIIRSFYSDIDDSNKSQSNFSMNDTCDASIEYMYTTEHDDGNILKRLFSIRYNHVPAIKGGVDITIRLNEIGANIQSLPKLGYDISALDFFDRISKYDEGIVIWTGSTSSGKTTSNASLEKLIRDNSKQTRKIITIGDPVEIVVPGTHPTSLFQNRSNVSSDQKNEAWTKAIEDCMRRAPHVVTVGEIRQSNVVNACIRLALSGHLALTTLHAYDPFQALNLLANQFNANLSTLLMPRVLRAIISQKLVPTVCPDCSFTFADKENSMHQNHLSNLHEFFGDDLSHLKFERIGHDCDTCNGHGRVGLTPIYEIFEPSESVIKMLLQGRFLESKMLWEKSKIDDGLTGITFASRAIKLVNEQRLCANWAFNKLLV